MTNNHRGTVSVVAVPSPASWHREADIVVIGSGAAGMPAAIFAREAGASVILVEAEPDIGGHAITSGGNVPLGGGTSAQKAAGIEDSPDLVFLDNTDWSVVQPNGFPDYRYNDRDLVRAFAEKMSRPMTGCWPMGSCSPTKPRIPLVAHQSVTLSLERCILFRCTGSSHKRANPNPPPPLQPDRLATV